MSDDNKEDAGVPVAWKVETSAGALVGFYDTPRDHSAAQYYGQTITPLFATPPAVMPAAPSDAVLRGIYYSAHDALGLAEWTKRARAALSQTMQPQAGVMAPVPYDKHEAEILAVIGERDRYHDMADQLAAQIAAITETDLGEHSSDNDPWRNAMLSADEWIARDLRAMFSGACEPRSKVRLTQPTTVQQAEQEPQREKAHEGPLVGDQIPVDHHATQSEQQSWWTTAILDGDKVGCTPPPPENSALASRGQEQRELDLYDEIECDLPYLFGRAAAEGHEASQRLAEQVREKMKMARAAL